MTIIGRVTRDAEVRNLSNNKNVVSFSIAVNHDYKDKNGTKVTQTEFFDCAYWFSTGVAQYLTKGSLVELAGRVSARAWMGNDGEPKAGLNFNTTDIKLHGGAKNETQQAQQKPQQQAQQQPVNQTASAAPVQNAEPLQPANAAAAPVYEAEVLPNGEVPNDDLPF
ncbi:single-stranded DNA-binding protein [Flavobacterium sp. AG291]|uniref:single-stranded DNA-binding protein n=1 Tax=Flavobacterium sp. AG291 TaxID=2184000 RepID=UPI000E0BC3C6|nr:single-stranded DNA-binding protein [Flavobacterium sp. AG291]RDI11276.1 single-strand DNA-binding protein [Flavobacterium sp. AG291]